MFDVNTFWLFYKAYKKFNTKIHIIADCSLKIVVCMVLYTQEGVKYFKNNTFFLILVSFEDR